MSYKIDLKKALELLKKNNFISTDILIDHVDYPEVTINKKTYVLFCSNNYLGLSNNQNLKNIGMKSINSLGFSTSESRKLGGNLSVYEDLEQKLAKFKNKEAGVIFATGLLANLATISALGGMNPILSDVFKLENNLGKNVVIYSDQYNHRSIQMGIKLSGATKVTYKHLDISDLKEKIKLSRSKNKIIITDAIFSMHGEIAPLEEISDIASTANALLMIDDAHGTGVLGVKGKGTAELLKVEDKVDINMGTLSKSFGGIGGFIATNNEIATWIKNVGSGYRFTSSIPPEQAAIALKAVTLIENANSERKCIKENIDRIDSIIKELSLKSNKVQTQIIPIYCTSIEQAKRYERILFEIGIIAPAVTSPVVEVNKPILRIVANATHTKTHLDMLEYGLRRCKKTDGKPKRT